MPTPTPQAEERTQRHLAQCQELAALGMQLARAAVARAADPEATPEQAVQATTLFTKLSHTVRQAIILENRVAEQQQAAIARGPAYIRDERRDYLREVLHNIAAARPDGLAFKREAYDRIDDALAHDKAACAPDLLTIIAHELGVIIKEEDVPLGWGCKVWPPIAPLPQPATIHQLDARRS